MFILLFTSFQFVQADDLKDFQDKKIIGVGYFNKLYGHVHKNPFRYSIGLTTISCGHPVKIYKVRNNIKEEYQDIFSNDWRFVKVGPYFGYLHIDNISTKMASCFQDKYPRFFEAMNLDISQMFYWGKLQDQYITDKTRAQ